MENQLWNQLLAYEEGAGGYTQEAVSDAAMACNSLPNGKWVTPENLLELE